MKNFTREFGLFYKIIADFMDFDIILGMLSSYIISLLGLKLNKSFFFTWSNHLDWNSSC